MPVLHDALRECHDGQVAWLLAHGADPNVRDADDDTPLLLAVTYGAYTWTIRDLLDRGADIHATDQRGATPLARALDHGSVGASADGVGEILREYARRGETPVIDPTLDGGRPALLFAIYRRDRTALRRLLAGGLNVEVRNACGQTPLMVAAKWGRLAALRTLLAHGADVHAAEGSEQGDRWTALHFAAYGGHAGCVRALLAYGADVEGRIGDGTTPLMWAALARSAATVRALLAHGTDVFAESDDGTTALEIAGRGGNAAIIRALLASGATENREHLQRAFHATFTDNNAAMASLFLRAGATVGLCEAILLRDKDSVEQLLRRGGVDVNAGYPLHAAVRNADFDLVRRLLQYGSDPNRATPDGRTPLMATYEPIMVTDEIVDLLLRSGAEIDARDREGGTALTLGTDSPWHVGTVRRLIERGADVNVRTLDGYTALMRASWCGCMPIVRMLLAHGADVHARDIRGRTVLVCAVEDGHTAIVHRLLAHGADPNVRDDVGRSPLSIARRWPGKRITSLLLEAGATE